ncbi:MAG: hypothetical protein JAY72_07940 [Candidatus Thiodiazotropha endolucinida]|nr:hypothetical protein [Candidatus Thiodiazotropha taylori]MCW4321597.1 hypothetical protein [Candidatus Thiodiazotropha taylori]
MSSLILETGSGSNPDSNTYISIEFFKEEIEKGYHLEGRSDHDIERAIHRAMAYLEQHWASFKGEKTSRDQPLEWPRIGVSVGRFMLPSNQIPKDLKIALVYIAFFALDNDLLPDQPIEANRVIIKEQVEAIGVEYDLERIKNLTLRKAKILNKFLDKKPIFRRT